MALRSVPRGTVRSPVVEKFIGGLPGRVKLSSQELLRLCLSNCRYRTLFLRRCLQSSPQVIGDLVLRLLLALRHNVFGIPPGRWRWQRRRWRSSNIRGTGIGSAAANPPRRRALLICLQTQDMIRIPELPHGKTH
jgi:hypothetical protein